MFLLLLIALSIHAAETKIPESFVDITSINPQIQVELRYNSEWNFIGRRIAGYKANKCYLKKATAEALSLVQKDVEKKGMSLLIFDCYRPQQAVNDFLDWAKTDDQKMKVFFYPDVEKSNLVKDGYISNKSSHSRGNTVDLTLIKNDVKLVPQKDQLKYQEDRLDCRQSVNIEAKGQLDMGTTYDCFSPLSNTMNGFISVKAQDHRALLKKAMSRRGFINYAKEWWHYTLRNESPQDKPFDFVIE